MLYLALEVKDEAQILFSAPETSRANKFNLQLKDSISNCCPSLTPQYTRTCARARKVCSDPTLHLLSLSQFYLARNRSTTLIVTGSEVRHVIIFLFSFWQPSLQVPFKTSNSVINIENDS